MQLSESLVRSLAAQRGEPFVTSLYLDVDGRRYPRPSDLDARVEHLFRLARARAAALGEDAPAALEADLAAVEGFFAEGLDRQRTRGVAAFSCARAGFLATIPLAVPVADGVHLDREAYVAPLLGALEGARPCLVVLVDRERARLVRLEGGEVVERPGPVDELARRVDTDVELGSFSRRHEEARRRHLRGVAGAVEGELRASPDAWLVVGGPEASGLVAELDGEATSRVAGELKVAMTASAHEVDQLAVSLRGELERRREAGLVDELAERSGTDATVGLGPTLDALAAGRVATLVVGRDLEVPGARCARCGGLAVGDGTCARCGGPLEAVADLAGAAIADALVAGGSVELVEVPGFAERGGIGAFERY